MLDTSLSYKLRRTTCASNYFLGVRYKQRFALCYRTVVLSVSNVGVLWPNGWMDQDATW